MSDIKTIVELTLKKLVELVPAIDNPSRLLHSSKTLEELQSKYGMDNGQSFSLPPGDPAEDLSTVVTLIFEKLRDIIPGLNDTEDVLVATTAMVHLVDAIVEWINIYEPDGAEELLVKIRKERDEITELLAERIETLTEDADSVGEVLEASKSTCSLFSSKVRVTEYEKLYHFLSLLNLKIDAHKNDLENPHNTTKKHLDLDRVTNDKQVREIGNNRIIRSSSFVIDGNADITNEDNDRGVLRIVNSDNSAYGAKGTVFLQAGEANSSNASSNGVLVLGGYYGGSLEECNVKLVGRDKLTVQIGASSNRYRVYHEAMSALTPVNRGDLGNIDLDELKRKEHAGFYQQSVSGSATLERNYPIESAGTLEVLSTGANGDRVVQRYTTHTTSHPRTYTRTNATSNDIFGKWVELASGRTISTTLPLQGGGDLSNDRTLSIRDATTEVNGAVRLNDEVNSTSKVQAATANAVKKTNDNANGRVSKGGDTLTGNLAIRRNSNEFRYISMSRVIDGETIEARFGNSFALATMDWYRDGKREAYLRLGDTCILKEGNTDSESRVYTTHYRPYADRWTTARTITFKGDAKGSVNIRGDANVDAELTIESMGNINTDNFIYGSDGHGAIFQKDLNLARKSGFYRARYPENGPVNEPWGEWLWYINASHNVGNGYGMQIAGENSSGSSRFWLRSKGIDGSGAWTQIFTHRHKPSKHTVELGNVDNVKQLPISGGTLTGLLKVDKHGVEPRIGFKKGDESRGSYPAGLTFMTGGTGADGWPTSLLTVLTYNSGSDSRSFQIMAAKDNRSIYWRPSHEGDYPGKWMPPARFYTTLYKPTKADVGLSNVDNVKQLPITGGTIVHRGSYFDIYRFNESSHGDADFKGGYLRTYVTFTRPVGEAVWQFSVRSDELGSDIPSRPIEIKLGSNYVYHQGRKPTKSDVGLGNVDNVKQAPSSRTINTTAPLQGGGNLSANRTLSIANASTSARGSVQLSTSVTSTSATTAATPSAVKVANDNANRRVSKGGDTLTGNLNIVRDDDISRYYSASRVSDDDIRMEARFGNGYRQATIDWYRDGKHEAYLRLGNTCTLKEGSADSASRVYTTNYRPYADRWTTARTITFKGDAKGSVNIRGDANVDAELTIESMGDINTDRFIYGDTDFGTNLGVEPNDISRSSLFETKVSAIDAPLTHRHLGLHVEGAGGIRAFQIMASDSNTNRVFFRSKYLPDGKYGEWNAFYHTGNKPTKADVGLPNVDNVKQLPITGGQLIHRENYFNIYRYNESHHGDPDFSGGYLRTYVSFTRQKETAEWFMDVRSDELGQDTPRRFIDINLAGKYVYHQGRKPTKSDVGLGNVDNVKQVPNNRKINTTAPLQGGGDLSADRTLSVLDAHTSRKGVVQLSTSINSNSNTTAATSYAVKQAYDLANSRVSTSRTITTSAPLQGGGNLSANRTLTIASATTSARGAVQLNDATDSTSMSHAATANAVKKVNDNANGRLSRSSGGTVDATVSFPKGIGLSFDSVNMVRSGSATDGLLLLGGNDSSEVRLVAPKITVATTGDGENIATIYHTGNKPTKSDVGLGNVDNVKQAPSSRTINTTAPLQGGGNLSADRTLSITNASTASSGVVQLSTSITSGSTTRAATSSAVKAVNDKVENIDSGVPPTRTISTTAPLSGGGNLSANRTLSIANASTSARGAVQLSTSVTSTSTATAATSSAVKATMDEAKAKVPTRRTISTTAPLRGGGSLTADRTLSITNASTSASGVVQLSTSTTGTSTTLAATASAVKATMDEARAKAPSSRTISTTAPLSGGGNLSANRTLSIASASTNTRGAVLLSTSITSTSTTTAATSSAVKAVNDRINISSVPVGACLMWPGTSPPTKWVEARGQSTSGMPQAIRDLYGSNLPDMRGEFPRGWDNGRGVDTGRSILTGQPEAYKSHNHSGSFRGQSVSGHTHTRGTMNIRGEAHTGGEAFPSHRSDGAFSLGQDNSVERNTQ